jgi:superfamily II RNA helicase
LAGEAGGRVSSGRKEGGLSTPRLDERIPEKGFRSTDEMFDVFMGWVADQGLEPYPHQQDAILELFSGAHVILDAPTGSGKSLVATALHFKTFAETGHAWYTAPIKALVSEKFFELCRVFGAENVGMMTGDGAVNRDAPILCCTAEILANLALREGSDAKVTSVVMDEFHYYADRDRGMAWQIPLLMLSNTTFLLMSGTLGDTKVIREDLEARTQKRVAEVRGAHRPVPLEFSYSMRPIHDALGDLVRSGKAPIYVVHFTQSAATEQAQALMSSDHCTREEKKAIAEAVKGFGFHSPFGPTIRRYVLHGVGLHHAGLLPRYRRLVEKLAQQGLLKIICGTDTLGVGINVPIRTVLFSQLCKYDGEKVIILSNRDFKQIAGRAGRAGFDKVGYVVVQAPAHVIENAKIVAMDPKRAKKQVKAQPPTWGYKQWDEHTFRKLVEGEPEPLESRFTIDHGRLLTLMQHAEDVHHDAAKGYDALLSLVARSHLPPNKQAELRNKAAQLLADLEQARVAIREGGDGEGGEGGAGGRLVLDPTLQTDFSLHHTLSLFLIDALSRLDPQSSTFPLDVVTWVEAILEHPRVVLQRQVEREKGKLVQELKAQGVPYEERMEKLEDVTWPKPLGEEIYAFYNAYAERHPWVKDEPIHPKSVVREMVETWSSFASYVDDLGLQRAEGVLLRYLTDAYKALEQNVPAELHSDPLLDVVAWLRAMLGRVDATLLQEWEQLVTGRGPEEEVRKIDISEDRRAFAARVRAELHALVRALSRREWDEAAAGIRRAEDGPWTPDEIAAALKPFHEEFGEVGFDHRARLAVHTVIRPVGPHQWEVEQRLFPVARATTEAYAIGNDEEEEPTWSIRGRIDLREDTNPEGPLVEVLAIGE